MTAQRKIMPTEMRDSHREEKILPAALQPSKPIVSFAFLVVIQHALPQRTKMARIHFSLATTHSWWPPPLLPFSAVAYYAFGTRSVSSGRFACATCATCLQHNASRYALDL